MTKAIFDTIQSLSTGKQVLVDELFGKDELSSASVTTATGTQTLADALNARATKAYLPINVKDHGAVGDGVADDTAAIQSAIDAAIVDSRKVVFPEGNYLQGSPISVALTSQQALIMEGAGRVEWLMNVGTAVTVNMEGNYWLPAAPPGSNFVKVSDISFSTENTAAGIAFNIVGSNVEGRPMMPSVFRNCEFRGYNGLSQYWAEALSFTDVSMTLVSECSFYADMTAELGRSVTYKSSSSTSDATHHLVNSCSFFYGNSALSMGNYVEGLYINNSSFVGCRNAVKTSNTQAESGLHISNCHLSTVSHGLYLSNMFDFNVTGNLIYVPDGFAGIYLENNVARFSISGNIFHPVDSSSTSDRGVHVVATPNENRLGGIISANSFHELSSGVQLGVNCEHVTVGSDNAFNGCAVAVSDSGTNNYVLKKGRQVSDIATLLGGDASETITFTLPDGMFISKPDTGFCISSDLPNPIIGSYSYGNSTNTTAQFLVYHPDGAALPSGDVRFSLSVSGL